ncbi:MAG: hypothetical protein GOVbin709_56 [Prokaryotic dsDNA virus sp.]|nr:MAG: hypothetical protein GOVbin709_56 [Prokaryotic dsDNA virus sp.]
MPRSSTLMEERAYAIVEEHGAMNTREILDRLNDYTNMNKSKSQKGYSMHQLSQKLRVSPFFICLGEDRMPVGMGDTAKTTGVLKYDVIPVKVIVHEKLAIVKEGGHLVTPVSKMPRFFKKEWVRQGGVL